MVKCTLCGRQVSDPTECIIYERYTFDRSTCLWIFKKLSFIYGTPFIEIMES
jgi:hypothetical protein